MLELDRAIAAHFTGDDVFEQILRLDGEVYRNFANRRTLRIELDGIGYFVKIHLGVGWKEIFKCLFSLRLPVLGALNEWRAIRRLEELGVDTMRTVGVGSRGANPADRQSFLITQELAGTVSLEDFCRDWPQNPPPYVLKRALVEKVAVIARQLHRNGVNHRDFYLCHFHLDLASVDQFLSGQMTDIKLHLIDLHRTQLRQKTPRRWRDKDLVGLYFSAMDCGLSQRDLLRFIRCYTGGTLRIDATSEFCLSYWRDIHRRACRFYEKFHGRRSPMAC